MRRLLDTIATRLGYRLTPLRKLREPFDQIAAALVHQGVDAVIDVGANAGQYASMLRRSGWRGPIVSIEPLAEVHDRLVRAAAGDATWTVLPAMALGADAQERVIERSAESDMSSFLPQSALLENISPSSRVLERRTVPMQRLDALDVIRRHDWRRLFVKIDTQGFEREVLAGCERAWPRIAGLQLELSLVPLYKGEASWRSLVDDLLARDYEPYLFVPGYYERKLARHLQVDVVFFERARTASGGSD